MSGQRLEGVDAVIITPMVDYCEIGTKVEEMLDCEFISLEDVSGLGFGNE